MRIIRILLLPVLLQMCLLAEGQHFITRWNMGVQGSAIGQLNVGVVTSGPCSYSWVTSPAGQSGSGTFSGDTMTISGLPTSGWIDLSIDTANFRQLRVANGPDKKRLIAVHQWGKMKWANCDSVFTGCSNMASLGVDTPDFSQVSSMEGMFAGSFAWSNNTAVYGVGSLPYWNTAAVTSMKGTFRECGMNPPVEAWDVSAVSDMSQMFRNAYFFNRNIQLWNVSSVTNMAQMFMNCGLFNCDLAPWDVSSVTSMDSMFHSCGNFNQSLNAWDVSSVTNMNSMFYYCGKLNRTFENWTFNNVVQAADCFSYSAMDCINFGISMIGWAANPQNPDSVHLTGYWPAHGPAADSAFSILTSLKGWTINSVFDSTCPGKNFETTWNMSMPGIAPGQLQFSVETDGLCDYSWSGNQQQGSGTFAGSQVLLTGLPVSGEVKLHISPKHFKRLHMGSSPDRKRLRSVDNWGKVQWSNLDSAFAGCTSMNVIAKWPPLLDSVLSMAYMFDSCISLTGSPPGYGYNFADWRPSRAKLLTGCFRNAIAFNPYSLHWHTDSAINMDHFFEGAISFNAAIRWLKVSTVKSMKAMFKGAKEFNQDIGIWNTVNVNYMDEMFSGALKFNQDIEDWKTDNVLSMRAMFKNTVQFNRSLNYWKTLRVKDMSEMFAAATSFNGSVLSFETDSVMTMQGMFKGASNFNGFLFWNVSRVEDMGEMFSGATKFNRSLSTWNTGKVKYMGAMFKNCIYFNQPIGQWDISQVLNMQGMLQGAGAFDQPLAQWVFHPSANTTNFLQSSGMTCHTYDSCLRGWASQNQASGIYLDAQRSYGDAGIAARIALQSQKGWTFNDYWTTCTPLGTGHVTGAEFRIGSLYPNPAQQLTFLDIESPAAGELSWRLSDVLGWVWLRQEQALQAGTNQISIPLQSLAPGLYTVALEWDGKRVVRRLEVGR